VDAAIARYDAMGQDAFLTEHGFQPSREYLLVHGGRSYDSKAIVGVAHLIATGDLPGDRLSGGKGGAARTLERLGYEVLHVPAGPSETTRSRSGADQPTGAVCPVHFIELPSSGVCDLCD
jgi:hypothetical protein